MHDLSARPAGDRAVLLEAGDLAATLDLLGALQASAPGGTEELVPAARTVLVRFDPSRTTAEAVLAHARALPRTPDAARGGDPVRIPVTYDGADLDEVAGLTGLSREEVVARHTAARYRVAFTGFAPGFAYLAGGDPALAVPRRSSPRTTVPTGSVGLAGEFSGVYPRASPGGWQLIGRTAVPMWDLAREVPALLEPGAEVEFHAVDEPSAAPQAQPSPPALEDGGTGLEVLEPGPLTLPTDDGRPGLAHLGVSASGAADRTAAHTANRLVGNDSGAPLLEVTLGGLVVRARGRQVLAVTGADVEAVRELPSGQRTTLPSATPFTLADGAVLRLSPARGGVRAYLAVRGGFRFGEVLGSSSRDVLAGLGPEPLRAGDVVPVGPAPRAAIAVRATPPPPPTAADVVRLRVVPGPRDDWFSPAALDLLEHQEWTVDARSNRVGLRLRGAESLQRSRDGELPSEGVVRGALQVPPDGQPILFGPDHPLTGGYPVIACVVDADLDLTGQLPPGCRIRFVPAGPGHLGDVTRG